MALAALVLAAERGAPSWALALLAAAGGACLPQLPAAMRSLWTALVEDADQRQTAYALAGGDVRGRGRHRAGARRRDRRDRLARRAAVLAAAALAGGSALAFSSTRAARRWRGHGARHGLARPARRAAACGRWSSRSGRWAPRSGSSRSPSRRSPSDRGSPALAGLLLAALSAGSLIGGLVYGARRWPGTPAARLPVLLLGLGAGFALLAVADAPAPLAGLLLLAGTLLAPVTVVGSTLLDTAAPAGTVTEGFTVMVMGIVMGIALGNAAGGAIVDDASYAAAVARRRRRGRRAAAPRSRCSRRRTLEVALTIAAPRGAVRSASDVRHGDDRSAPQLGRRPPAASSPLPPRAWARTARRRPRRSDPDRGWRRAPRDEWDQKGVPP